MSKWENAPLVETPKFMSAPKVEEPEKRDYRGIVKGLTPEQEEKAQSVFTGLAEDPTVKTVKGLSAGFGTGATLGLSSLIPALKKETEIAKKETPKAFGAGEVASFLAPGTGPTKLFKGAGKVAGKILPKIGKKVAGEVVESIGKKALRTGIQSGISGGVRETVRGTAETGDFVKGLKRGAIAAPVEAVTGGVLEGVSGGLGKLGGKILKKVLPGKKQIPKGFKPEHINELKVAGTVKESLKKSQVKIDKLSKEVGGTIDDFVAKNPNKKVYVNELFSNAKQDIDGGLVEAIEIGEEEAGKRAITKIFNSAQKQNKLGELNIKQLYELKNKIGKMAFKKTTAMTPDADIVKRNAQKHLWTKLMEKIDESLPEIAPKNQDVHKLMNIKQVAEDAIEAAATRKGLPLNDIFRMSALLTGSGFYAAGHEELGAIVGLSAIGSKAGTTGKGAQIISALGRGVGKEGVKRVITGFAGSQAAKSRIKKEEEEEKLKFKGRF
ncbi:MAG TPA: hypothetical protein VMW25_00205 [Clostridia bacterium]|nr:hypothetical protein [Clostridia bacterium]